MFKKILEIGGLVALMAFAIIGLVAVIPGAPSPQKFGNATASFVDATLGFRVNGTEVISSSAVVDGSVSSTAITGNTLTANTSITIGGGGTAVTRFACGTTTFTVPVLGRRSGTGTGIATTSITVTNAKVGDPVVLSQNSSTDALILQGIGNTATAASGSVIVGFFNPTDATTTAVTTSTIRACVISVQ